MQTIFKKSDIENYISFLASNGIILEKYQNILELNSSIQEALAIDTVRYKQFLLSQKVSYTQLYIAKLNGQ